MLVRITNLFIYLCIVSVNRKVCVRLEQIGFALIAMFILTINDILVRNGC